MAKSKVAVTPAKNDVRAVYRVMDGVERVNGVKVNGKTVSLTPSESLYDLALGRIALETAVDVEVLVDGGA